MKKILVTGGLGHIGSRLIRDLLKKGFFITCVDNLSTQRISSLRGLLENKTLGSFSKKIWFWVFKEKYSERFFCFLVSAAMLSQ